MTSGPRGALAIVEGIVAVALDAVALDAVAVVHGSALRGAVVASSH